ncbi:MAG: carotenoid oxygenase family protein, partial [Pseudomonadota bacterium]
VWTEQLKGMPFSAHPKVAKNGHIWNFGQSIHMQALIVYQLDAQGNLLQAKLVRDVPSGMIHDFCITDRHLIFVANSFRATQHGKNYLSHFAYQSDAPQRVIVLDMDNLDARRDFDIPPGFQFHFGNAYEDKGGNIRFTMCETDQDKFVSHGAKQLMRGELPEGGDPSRLCEVVLKTNGQATLERISDVMVGHEFPRFNPAFGGQAARYLYTVGNKAPGRPGETAILRHDLKSGRVDAHDYGPDNMVEEHLFVPSASPKGEADGWLVGTTLDFKAKVTHVNVLRADALSDGPVAVFELPYALPLGFHGTWA